MHQTINSSLKQKVLSVESVKKAQIVHEIKQPLAAMTMLAEITLEDLDHLDGDTVNQIKSNLTKIVEQGLLCSRIIERMRKASTSDRLNLEPANVKSIIQKSLKEVQFNRNAKHIMLNQDLQKDLPVINADKDALHQVFTNLINNAVDAMQHSSDKLLTVKCSENDGSVRIEISDTGCGISPENKNKIFDSFYSTKSNNGMGLGLHICKSIIEQHNGTITVKSTENIGTCFSIILPAI